MNIITGVIPTLNITLAIVTLPKYPLKLNRIRFLSSYTKISNTIYKCKVTSESSVNFYVIVLRLSCPKEYRTNILNIDTSIIAILEGSIN